MTRRLISILLSVLSMAMALPGAAKEFTVVIDPGHGGNDAGALGNRTNEKTVNLKVALKLRDLINDGMDDAKVVMTRDDDNFVKLQGRADIANKNHADIFISIHANSVDRKSPMRTKVNGASVYTLGLQKSETNLNVAMRENAVMKLEPDYTTTYQGFDPTSAESYIAFEMMQHANLDQSIALAEAVQNQLVRTAGRKNNGVRQAPFWVLVRTSMPAILVELDFICNPAMEKFMASEDGQDKLARAIYNGISKYRKGTTSLPKPVKKEKPARTKTQAKPDSGKGDKADKPKTPAKQEKTTQSKPAETPTPTPAPAQAPQTAAADASGTVFKIQILTASAPLNEGDRRLKGLSPVSYYQDGKAIKYTYGSYTSSSQASADLKMIRKSFPDAFVIKMVDGKRVK